MKAEQLPQAGPPSPTAKAPRSKSPRGKPSRRGRGVYFAIAAVAALAYLGIAPRLRQAKVLSTAVSDARDELPLVSVTTAKLTPSVASATLPSNIQAIEQTVINARTSGYVSECSVDIGSHVVKGQVLAVIQSPEVDQQVSQSEAELAKSRAGIGQAAADTNKMQAGITTAQSEQTRAESQESQAEADLAHLGAAQTRASAAVMGARAKVLEAQQRLVGMRADESRAKVESTMAKKTLDRWLQLEKANAVSGQEADEKQTDYDASRARVEAAAAAVSTAAADVEAAQEAVHAAEADVRASQADMESGKGKVRAAKAAVAASRSNVVAARSGLDASHSSEEAARAMLSSSQAGLRRVAAVQGFERLTAPFSGVITARNVDVGDLVNPTSGMSGASDPNNAVAKGGLFGLARTDVLRAVVNVPENQIGDVREGQEAEIRVQELPGRTFTGSVFHVSGALDAASRTLHIEVRIPNPDGVLKPGVYGQVKFLGAANRSSLEIPATALIFDSRGTRVGIVLPDGTMHFANVTVGKDSGDTIEITSGLKGGETIVTNADNSLKEGDHVRPRKESV